MTIFNAISNRFLKSLITRSKSCKLIGKNQAIQKRSFFLEDFCTVDPPKAMSKIVWMDMEMTGLNVDTDRIMEVACIITNNDLRILAEGPNIVIHQPDSVLNVMDKWCTDTHTKVC